GPGTVRGRGGGYMVHARHRDVRAPGIQRMSDDGAGAQVVGHPEVIGAGNQRARAVHEDVVEWVRWGGAAEEVGGGEGAAVARPVDVNGGDVRCRGQAAGGAEDELRDAYRGQAARHHHLHADDLLVGQG